MITQKELKRLLSYDKETGEFTWRYNVSSRARKGDTAGALCQGYMHIRIDGVGHKAHRLAFLYVKGRFTKLPNVVDHINGIKTDNRWINLQECTQKSNVRKRNNTVKATINGVEKPLVEWCDELGTNYNTAKSRIRNGESPESAINFGVKI